MRRVRLSVRGKIMGTIIAVAMLVLALGAWAAYDAVTSTGGRGGAVLEKHFLRYKAGLADLGTSEYAIARLLASDPTLAAALEAGEPAQVVEVAKRVVETLQGTVAPDLLTISDATGSTYSGGGLRPIAGPEYRSSRIFSDLREGKGIRGKIAVVGGKAFRISGAAVRVGERVVGTVLIGQRMDTWFNDVAANSGSDKPEKQHRLSLVAGDKVIASALPKDQWDALAQAAASPKTASEGESSVPVLVFSGKTWDLWSEPVFGYERGSDPEVTKLGTLVMVRTREHQAAKIRDAVGGMALVFGIALLLALLMGYALAVQITRPLRKYIEATEELTRGEADLGKRLEVDTNDELGQLAGNLNRVFAKIHSLASGVQRTAFQVGASSGEVSSISKQMLDGSKEQAGRITSSTAAVTELSSSIQQVAENAAEATRTAKQSGEAVTRAIARLSQIRKTVEDAADRIATLGESGKRIGNIVEVIRQISEQTTMLALNAAIEAAHAGEHGRGFAVVADEVSSLAKRTGQSARDIEDLIATIRDQTGEAVRVMQDGTREVEEGTGLVETTLADLKTLVNVIDDTAAAVQEQAIASDEIARNMDAVQRIATSVLASSESAVSQGEKLQGLADALEESVGGFRIDPDQALLDDAELKALPAPKGKSA
ncbi:MAG TPA: HAMP domain-containing methyl-accepting chemotaxis protein [Polyangiaceae bacterium]|nr:HAMP domain-containing methyl-accepting chemotaxis protein [Polyangiaceae bacterium]